jgi:hypothetical protein
MPEKLNPVVLGTEKGSCYRYGKTRARLGDANFNTGARSGGHRRARYDDNGEQSDEEADEQHEQHEQSDEDADEQDEQHEHGNARRVGDYRRPPVRLEVAEQYGEGTVVAIDPGNTEQASTRTGGNSETPECINRDLTPYQLVSRDQWRHEVGVNELNKKVAEARQNRALDQSGGALHGGGSVMSLKVATAAAAAGALRARRFHFLEIYKALTSKPLKRLRRTNKRRRASAIDRLINWFLGRDNKHTQLPAAPVIENQSNVKLVLIGDGSRMNGIKGTKSSVPWAELRRRFAQRGRNEGLMAVLNNEHCTSTKSACCGVRNRKAYKNKDINYRLVRKDGRNYRPLQYSLLVCSRCGKSLQRNGAAATNQAHVGTYTRNGWGTPPWLRHGFG